MLARILAVIWLICMAAAAFVLCTTPAGPARDALLPATVGMCGLALLVATARGVTHALRYGCGSCLGVLVAGLAAGAIGTTAVYALCGALEPAAANDPSGATGLFVVAVATGGAACAAIAALIVASLLARARERHEPPHDQPGA